MPGLTAAVLFQIHIETEGIIDCLKYIHGMVMGLEVSPFLRHLLGAVLDLQDPPPLQGDVQDGLEGRGFLITHVDIIFLDETPGQPHLPRKVHLQTETLVGKKQYAIFDRSDALYGG